MATPSNLHVKHAKAMLGFGIHVMVEKPLSNSLSGVYKLQEIVYKSDSVFMMAHTYRFREEWQRIKSLLDSAPVGKVYTAEFSGGLYLPDWHYQEDYRKEYAANKKQGGGVLLTSLSHFFDLVDWYFGKIINVAGVKSKQSDLDLDVEDVVTCTVKTDSGILVTFYEDFLSRSPRRTFRVNGEFGYIEIDFNRKTLCIWDSRKNRFLPSATLENDIELFRILEDGIGYKMEPELQQLGYSGNDAYLAELKHFLNLVDKGESDSKLNIDAGMKVLEVINHARLQNWMT
ncbi:Gfo/Idh/MocA family oxidoreductase [Vibrio sp. S4M6]|nr:Gfo/Idh/MocA family oxidoreductase [Vibrio sinus]